MRRTALCSRAPGAGEEVRARAGEADAAGDIEETERFAQLGVRFGLEIEAARLAPAQEFDIVFG